MPRYTDSFVPLMVMASRESAYLVGNGSEILQVASRLATNLCGAVLVCGDEGRLLHHAVADDCNLPLAVTDAIVRKSITSLLPTRWPRRSEGGWVVSTDSGLTISRQIDIEPEHGGLTVLTAASRRLDMRMLLAGLDELRAVTAATVARSGSPAAALLRLVTDHAEQADVAALRMPLTGARLVVLHRPGGELTTHSAESWLGHPTDAVLAAHPCGDLVLLVRDLPRRPGHDRGLWLAKRLCIAAQRCHRGVTAGISAAITDPTQLGNAFRDAADAARFAAEEEQPIVVVDEVWAQVVISRLRACLPAVSTSASPLTTLAAHDRERNGEFMYTLAQWLANDLNTKVTANLLNLHSNTLRYRLRRISEISGLNLSDPAHRLVARLTLDERPVIGP